MKVFCKECEFFRDTSSFLGESYVCDHPENRRYWRTEDTPVYRAFSSSSGGDCLKCNKDNDCGLFKGKGMEKEE